MPLGGPTEINRPQKYLVQVPLSVPPEWRIGLRLRCQKWLCNGGAKRWIGGVVGDDGATGIGQNEQGAARQPPKIARRILNSTSIVCGHERANIRQIGGELGGVREIKVALALHITERENRIVKVADDFLPRLLLYHPADHQQGGAGQARRNQQHRQRYFGS